MAVSTAPLFSLGCEEATSDDYYTPEWVFDALGLTFDLDVCAPAGGVPWVPAARYFSIAEDGLSQPWDGRVWMNPPFSGAAPWIDRFIEHANGVCLVQVSKTGYSRALWASSAAIWFVDTDMRFVVPMRGKRSDVYMPLWLAAFGDECVEALGRLGRVR